MWELILHFAIVCLIEELILHLPSVCLIGERILHFLIQCLMIHEVFIRLRYVRFAFLLVIHSWSIGYIISAIFYIGISYVLYRLLFFTLAIHMFYISYHFLHCPSCMFDALIYLHWTTKSLIACSIYIHHRKVWFTAQFYIGW